MISLKEIVNVKVVTVNRYLQNKAQIKQEKEMLDFRYSFKQALVEELQPVVRKHHLCASCIYTSNCIAKKEGC
jgi:hypothetical protein